MDSEKIKLVREFLGKTYSAFFSERILSSKAREKEEGWFLKRHSSTWERFNFYKEVYFRLLKDFRKEATIFDLGCGINGLSYCYFPKKVNYVGVEAIGQLVKIGNEFFSREKISGKVVHASLFDLKKLLDVLKKGFKPKVIFLFKVLDSLEAVEKNYSKTFLKKIVPLSSRVVVSFATKSLRKKTRFKVNRNWIFNFINENFEILDDFEIGGERYLVFSKK